MKIIACFATLFFAASCHSQENLVSQAKQNDDLAIWTSGGMVGGCTYLEHPVYYINERYVVYQDCKTRKILQADIPTFKPAKYGSEYGIALDKNGVYIKGDLVATDTAGFTVLGVDEKDILWKTGQSVYRNTKALPQLDARAFTPLSSAKGDTSSNVYFKDSQSVCFFDRKIEGADPATATLVREDSRSFYDKGHLYKEGEVLYFDSEPLQYVNSALRKTATKVIYDGKVLPQIDVRTLVALSDHYAKDKNHVYCETFGNGLQTLPINTADFGKLKVWDHTNSAYISDGKNLFYREQMLPKDQLDVTTFGTFGFTDFIYDKRGVYKRHYNKKLGKVVYERFPFKYTGDVMPNNLQITKGSDLYVYYKDQAYCESKGTLYENLTPAQIEATRNQSRKNRKRLEKVDGQTVLRTLLDYKLYRDDTGVYYDNKRTDADAASFRALGHDDYYMDNTYLYHYDREKGLQALPYMDVSTVKYFNGFLVDKNYLYRNGIRIIRNDDLEILASYPGYRPGCGLDPQPDSDSYLFRNAEGFWWVKVSNDVTIRYFGKTLNTWLSPLFENLEIPGR